MSYADRLFKETCRDILENGTDTKGELVHIIADAHIYDRHVPMIQELLTREEHPAPKVSLNPEVKDFYQFTTQDLIVEDYVTGEQIKNIPVAV